MTMSEFKTDSISSSFREFIDEGFGLELYLGTLLDCKPNIICSSKGKCKITVNKSQEDIIAKTKTIKIIKKEDNVLTVTF